MALLVGAAVYAAWSLLSRRGARGPAHEATRFVDAVERQLARAGVRPGEGETLEDLSARLGQQAHPLAPTLAPLTRRYLEARFGQRPLRSGEAARMLQELERGLAAWKSSLPPGTRAS
jgi:hypothetical protein